MMSISYKQITNNEEIKRLFLDNYKIIIEVMLFIIMINPITS
jgi:hypothetical protein